VTHTARDALTHARARLQRADASDSDAVELVSRLLGVGRAAVHLEGDRSVDAADWERLERWLHRREAGEPVQYITGRAAFRGLDLAVNPSVLVPRPETEVLVETVLGVLRAEQVRWPRPRVLDLGTGSGAIALAIAAEHPHAIVTATDSSPAALELARANAQVLGLSGRVHFLEGDWLSAVGADDRFEAIVSNPPYIATGEWDELPHDVRAFEPASALFSGATGLEALREIVDESPRHLGSAGLLALELAEQRAEEVAAWLTGAHDWSDVRLVEDLTGRPRVLLARRTVGPAIAPAQWEEER
jgi:release factor glutamine methyltransferase